MKLKAYIIIMQLIKMSFLCYQVKAFRDNPVLSGIVVDDRVYKACFTSHMYLFALNRSGASRGLILLLLEVIE